MKNVFVSHHPLTASYLGVLRDKTTTIALFREASHKLSEILLFEATHDLPIDTRTVETPLRETQTNVFSDEILFIPILRAGLAFLPSSLAQFPNARVGMIGLKRDEQTAIAREYYSNIPSLSKKHVFLLDPMLATGGSTLHLLKRIGRNEEILSLRLITAITAPEGIEAVHADFSDLPIYTAAIDERLNDKKFIVPGLGDFGDRYFGTE